MIRLEKVRGENATEEVYFAQIGRFELYVKHEYEAAPSWEWIIMEGAHPVNFGEATTRELATEALEAAARELDELDELAADFDAEAPAGPTWGQLAAALTAGALEVLVKKCQRWIARLERA